MKPDKIYIQEGAILRTEKTYDNDVCYIRADLALTWGDMRTINDLFLKVDAENGKAWDYEVIEQDLPFPYGQKFYEEVLRRFREMKDK